jgi:RimJ/RimL family protein N-acetyltransferase
MISNPEPVAAPTADYAANPRQNSIQFRVANPADTKAINRLLEIGYPKEIEAGLRVPYHPKAYEKGTVIVAEYGAVIGVIFLNPGMIPGSAALVSGVVDPNYRGQGVCTQLVKVAMNHAARCKINRIYAVFGAENRQAMQICERLGLINSHATIQDEWCRKQVEYYHVFDQSLSANFTFIRTLSLLLEKVGASAYRTQLKDWNKILRKQLQDGVSDNSRLRQFRGLWQRVDCLDRANPDEVAHDMKTSLPPSKEEQAGYLLEVGDCRVRFARDEDKERINEMNQLCFPEDYESKLMRPYSSSAYKYAAAFVAEYNGVVAGSEFFVPGGSPGSVLVMGGSVHPDYRGRRIYSFIAHAAQSYLLKKKILWHYAFVLVKNKHMQRIMPKTGFKKQHFIVQDELCRPSNRWDRVFDDGISHELRFSETLCELQQNLGDNGCRELIAKWSEQLTQQISSSEVSRFLDQEFAPRSSMELRA